MRTESAVVNPARFSRRVVFGLVWALTAAGITWLLLAGGHTFGASATLSALAVLLICTVSLLWWLRGFAAQTPSIQMRTRRGWLILFILFSIAVLFPLRDLFGPPPVLALLALVWIRRPLSKAAVGYALLLALVSAAAGLGAGWVTISPPVWAALQVALVLTGLLAGWSLLERAGLLRAGIGQSLFLTEGFSPALRGFLLGMLLSLPWALGLIVLGSANGEEWVQHWWQPLLAIQPAISEEAWGRVLLVSALFLPLRRIASGRTALATAAILMAYWFAYLHTPGGFSSIFSVLMIGTLFALPTTYLWLRHGLETAIGFHFCLDLMKFIAAYLINQNLWFS
jgi:hypothetical protein